jgi:hypothetical protein
MPQLPVLLGLPELAARLGLPEPLARHYVESRCDPPVATYRGRPLWLAESLHDALAEKEAIRARGAA